jgi:hypothetical protein
MQPESNDVNRRRGPHPGAATLKELQCPVGPAVATAWGKDGPRGFAVGGLGSPPRLGEAHFVVLEAELEKGPVSHGWPYQRWTCQGIRP